MVSEYEKMLLEFEEEREARKRKYKEDFPCWRCGEKITCYREPRKRVFCKKCAREHSKEYNSIVKKVRELKYVIMHETALKTIDNSKSYAHEYKEASDFILEMALSGDETFNSSYEMVVAMVLYEYAYEYKINYKIDKYLVDFYIPELKVCLEVDGERHKNRTVYDNERDIRIREVLGADWEVVRIPVKYIEIDPSKVPDAIMKVREEKQKLRKQLGFIPDGFSERERDHYYKILNS